MQDRIKPLDGVVNFRDFGGYATQDGGEVVRGKLFRTASFAEASTKDIDWLSTLGAKFIVDLRRPEERTEMPNRWPGDHIRVVTSDEGYKELPPHIGVMTQTDLTAAAARAYMITAYSHYPYEPRYVGLFRSWIHGLAEEGGPAIVHCAAGKDRTGVACMLVLTALGVDRETIMTDYELTNTAVDYSTRMPQIRQRISERAGHDVAEEAIRPMLGVHRDYLEAAYAVIAERYPDVPSYMDDVLGVDAAMVEKLRRNFLT